MRTIGVITTAIVTVVAIVGAAVGVKSIPDLQRYLRIRQM